MHAPIRLTAAAVILAIGLVLAAGALSKLFVNVAHEKAITVKGYAEEDVTANIGTFTCAVRARGNTLPEAFAGLQTSRAAVLAFIAGRGFHPDEIAPESIDTSRVMKRNDKGNELNETEFFDARQSITVTSTNVARIHETAIAVAELIREGHDVSVFAPDFLLTDLKAVKLRLLALATEDGYRRAQALASNSHARVGALVSAEQGVLQITRRNSTDTSGYGAYDTATIAKTVKAVVTLEYRIATAR